MAKDDDWTTVTKKEKTGRPKDPNAPTSTTTSIGSSSGESIYKKGIKVGSTIGGGGSSGPVQKKYKAGTNKQRQQAVATRKADSDELDSYRHEYVPRAWGLAIAQTRQKKNISREDLARSVNEKVTVIADVENGKSIINNALIAKIERALGTKVRGQ